MNFSEVSCWWVLPGQSGHQQPWNGSSLGYLCNTTKCQSPCSSRDMKGCHKSKWLIHQLHTLCCLPLIKQYVHNFQFVMKKQNTNNKISMNWIFRLPWVSSGSGFFTSGFSFLGFARAIRTSAALEWQQFGLSLQHHQMPESLQQ